MYRNFITFSKLCEYHRSLVQIHSSSVSFMTKFLGSHIISRNLRSTSYFARASCHAAFFATDSYLPSSKINNSNNSSQPFYHQPRRQNSYFLMMNRPEWESGSFVTTPSTRRRCSSSSSSIPELEGTIPIHFWGYETEPFGTLNIEAPFQVLVKPLNPDKYPEMNRAFVRLLIPDVGDKDQDKSKRSSWLDLYEVETNLVEDQLNVTGKVPKDILGDYPLPITCFVEIPVKFNVKVKVQGEANVFISNMESSDDIFVRTESGNCRLKNVKSGLIDVRCESGSFESMDVLQGNIKLDCGGEGTIKVKRLQGQDISCQTYSGDMDIADIYAENSMISASQKTNLSVGSCHGETLININSGNINIKSVEGNLEAITQRGHVDVALTNTRKKVYVCSKWGDVVVGLPKPVDVELDLLAAGIRLTKDFTYLMEKVTKTEHSQLLLMALEETIGNPNNCILTADAKIGILTIKYQDWLSSFGLKLNED